MEGSVPSSRRFDAAIALSALALVAGCTATSSGKPGAQSPPPGTATAGDDSPLPPRPRDIGLDGVNPCTLWTADQLAALALMPNPRRSVTTAGDDICHFDALDQEPPEITLSVATIVDHDAANMYLPDHGDTIIDVARFPAVRSPADPAGLRPCQVLVSTAPGQTLEITLDYSSTKNHLSTEQACELTVKAATLAMQTLQSQR
jgi:hypothetical protein